jgi:hypothetical protein
VLYLAVAATGAGMHVVGYGYLPHQPALVQTLVLAVAIPVLVFIATLSILNAWLVPAPNTGSRFQIATAVLPVGAILLSVNGCPLWVAFSLYVQRRVESEHCEAGHHSRSFGRFLWKTARDPRGGRRSTPPAAAVEVRARFGNDQQRVATLCSVDGAGCTALGAACDQP